MNQEDYAVKAGDYVQTLCRVQPNRRTGSTGNRQAVQFLAGTLHGFGFQVDTTPFECLDYAPEAVRLEQNGRAFPVLISPYSLGCDVTAELVAVSTIDQLQQCPCRGKIVLLHGPICAEQIMPKKFVFYNPQHHQQLIAMLEHKGAAALITATERSPQMVGAQYPFPLFLDGDFDIPSVYCSDIVGRELAEQQGKPLHLQIEARRIPAQASNVVARLHPQAGKKIVIMAHMDAYEESPGALDNASGTAVLLLLAQMLADYYGPFGLEITAFNGEDHYSAAGQMDYLRRYGTAIPQIKLAVNIDGIGYRHGRSAYSFYQCPLPLEQEAEAVFTDFQGLVHGQPWYSGDHMIFVQQGTPSMAWTSEKIFDLMKTVVHTAADRPQLIDPLKLTEVAHALNTFLRSLA